MVLAPPSIPRKGAKFLGGTFLCYIPQHEVAPVPKVVTKREKDRKLVHHVRDKDRVRERERDRERDWEVKETRRRRPYTGSNLRRKSIQKTRPVLLCLNLW